MIIVALGDLLCCLLRYLVIVMDFVFNTIDLLVLLRRAAIIVLKKLVIGQKGSNPKPRISIKREPLRN